MIGKLLKGRGMRGLLDYLLADVDQKGDTRPRVKLIGGTFASSTARQIAKEFAVLRSLRPGLEVAVVHETLRLPPGAPEPTDEEWFQIAQYWTSRMKFQAWFAVAHGDGHIHICASRILIDGSVVPDFQDWTLSERIVRDIEKDFGLDIIKASHLLEPSRDWIQQKAPSQAQLAVTAKTHLPLPSDIVAATIDGLLSAKPSAADFVKGLEAAGIDVRPNVASTGKMSGFAYGIGDVLVTAKSLGNGYKWANLQRAGLSFEPDRDLPALRAAQEKSAQRAADRLLSQAESGATEDDTVLVSVRAAEEYISRLANNFVEAAGSSEFLVVRNAWTTDGHGFPEFKELLRPDLLRELLTGWTSNSPVKAEILDTRIIAVTDLSMGHLDELSKIGLEPFAVTEVEPNVFEACIRLLPASDPAPSDKVHRQAATMVAEKVGGVASESFFVPGFAGTTLHLGRKRRNVVTLRRAVSVVAKLGAELVRVAISYLEALKREVQAALKMKSERHFERPIINLLPSEEPDALEQLLQLARQRPAAAMLKFAAGKPPPSASEEIRDTTLTGPE